MLKAKLDSVRKNKKGFSLVELIIVIAIMVALIAVMAPQFVKYVKSSRDATMQSAAEDVLAFAKSEYAVGALDGTGTITVGHDDKGHIEITLGDTLTYTSDLGEFDEACGVDTEKVNKSEDSYTITIEEGPVFSMEKD